MRRLIAITLALTLAVSLSTVLILHGHHRGQIRTATSESEPTHSTPITEENDLNYDLLSSSKIAIPPSFTSDSKPEYIPGFPLSILPQELIDAKEQADFPASHLLYTSKSAPALDIDLLTEDKTQHAVAGVDENGTPRVIEVPSALLSTSKSLVPLDVWNSQNPDNPGVIPNKTATTTETNKTEKPDNTGKQSTSP